MTTSGDLGPAPMVRIGSKKVIKRKIITFKDYMKSLTENREILNSFLNDISDYIDMDDKTVTKNIIKNSKKLGFVEKKSKVYRYDCKEPTMNEFGVLSTSTSKLKGKVLKGIEKDMVHKSKTLGGVKDCTPKYYEIENVEGIDISKVFSNIEGLDNEEYLKDLCNRIKSEKEFLVIKM